MESRESSTVDPAPLFQIEPVRPIEELRRAALEAEPPDEQGTFREPELVDLATLGSSIRFDIRYATRRNFMGTSFYRSARAYLQKPAADALLGAVEDLSENGYGVVVYDAYRPWYVTKMFWDATPDSLKHFVAPPETGSRHNRGAAVDLGLYNLKTGAIVPMPSGYDEFTERAYADFEGGPPAPRRHREILRRAMERHGFTVYPYEWWHYDFEEWREYPILNVPFEEIDG